FRHNAHHGPAPFANPHLHRLAVGHQSQYFGFHPLSANQYFHFLADAQAVLREERCCKPSDDDPNHYAQPNTPQAAMMHDSCSCWEKMAPNSTSVEEDTPSPPRIQVKSSGFSWCEASSAG